MLFKRILVKYLLYVDGFHKILEMSSVPNSQSVGQFFYKKYSVSVQSVLRIFLKSTRFQFSRFYGYFRKVVGWILCGFETFSKCSPFFWSVLVFFFYGSRFFVSRFCPFFLKLLGFDQSVFQPTNSKVSRIFSNRLNIGQSTKKNTYGRT